MNLEFKWQDSTVRCKLRKINLFYGGNFTGKSDMAQLLESGFNGQIQGFEADHQQIKKKDFETVLCSNMLSMNDELKLTSKTILSKEIKKIISDFDEENSIIEQLNQCVLKLNEKLNRRWEELGIVDSESFCGEFMFKDLNKLIKNQYLFYDNGLNDTESKIKYYHLCYNYLSEYKESVLIIDDFDSCLDLFHCISLLEFFERADVTVIAFVKSAELCTYCIEKYPIFLMCRNLKEYSDYYKTVITTYTMEENRRNLIIYTQEEEIEFNLIKYKLYNQLFLQYINQFQMNVENFKKINILAFDLIEKFGKI